MFGNLKVSKPKSNTNRKSGKREITRTTAFVQALVNEKIRISYAALADAAEALGEHTATNMSAGQRGAMLVKGLPMELQPHVCRSNGGYAKGQEWETETPSDLRNRAYVRPEAVLGYVEAFVAATTPSTDEVITEETSEASEA